METRPVKTNYQSIPEKLSWGQSENKKKYLREHLGWGLTERERERERENECAVKRMLLPCSGW